jgi:hypothetical protein
MNNDIDPDETACDLCGEPCRPNSPLPSENEVGEFFDPDEPMGSKHYICHADCGLSYGLELA